MLEYLLIENWNINNYQIKIHQIENKNAILQYDLRFEKFDVKVLNH